MNAAEAIVVAQLESWRFRCEPFTKAELRATKTPDRRVYLDQRLVFFLEVKEIARDEFAGGLRDDPRFNRLASDIYEAVKQFDAVNSDRYHPNVLAFVNNDLLCSPSDLEAVLTGEAKSDDSEALRIHSRVAFGRIADAKHRIDAYIWFDGPTPVTICPYGDRRHEDQIRQLLVPRFESAG